MNTSSAVLYFPIKITELLAMTTNWLNILRLFGKHFSNFVTIL